jgi:hypothetical protein
MYTTTPFSGIEDSVTIENVGITTTGGVIIYVKSLKKFVYRLGSVSTPKYYDSWGVDTYPYSNYMDSETGKILPNKLFEYNNTLYLYDKTSGELVQA